MPDKMHGKMKRVTLEEIHVGDRVREEFGNLEELGLDIAAHGLYQPILILELRQANREPIEGKEYLLLAGERRYRAIELYQKRYGDSTPEHMVRVPCYIYNRELDDNEILIIEFHENEKRVNFSFKETAIMRKRLHEALRELRGDAHTQVDTAAAIGVNKATVTQELKIAAALESEDPELKQAVEGAKGKAEALKNLRSLEMKLAKEELARRQREKFKKNKEGRPEVLRGDALKAHIMDFYQVTSFEEGISQVPDRSIDLVELDPDYAIEFSKSGPEGARKGRGNMDEYHEIPPEDYEDTLRGYLEEAYRVMKDHSWCLLWFSIRWYKETRDIAREVGFQVPDIPLFWVKTSGNSATPAFQLGNDFEFCLYLRKGTPRLVKQGRSNAFHFRTPRQHERNHPAEKPIELYRELFSTFILQGSKVLVGFAGSGNALLAAQASYKPVGFDLGQRFKDHYDLRVANEEPGTYKTYKSEV